MGQCGSKQTTAHSEIIREIPIAVMVQSTNPAPVVLAPKSKYNSGSSSDNPTTQPLKTLQLTIANLLQRVEQLERKTAPLTVHDGEVHSETNIHAPDFMIRLTGVTKHSSQKK